MIRRGLLFVAAMTLTAVAGMAAAGEYSRLARLSSLDGHVSFQHPDEVDWTAASINMALQPGDRLYTGEDGRAEIEIDEGSVLHLAEKTDLELLSLNDDFVQVRVSTGLVTLTLRSSVAYEIGTPAAAFDTLRKGVYRFDVVDSGETDAIVRKGLLDAANDTFSRQVEAGELLHVTPGLQGTNIVSQYGQRDAWDEWTDRSDAEFTAYDSRKYLPDSVYMGVNDLDTYGRWVVVDAYGPAWVPNDVDADWSPYSVGRWWYRPAWGWTWVSYEPWGWLPYHYGRWYHHGSFGWCWIPGMSFGFHFWSPGLVRFYLGPSWVSWCPLGPGDYYNVNNLYFDPAYTYYLNNIRLIQRRGPEELVNRNVPGAFRTVESTSFLNTSFGPRGSSAQVNGIVQQPWREGRMVSDRLDLPPTSRSYSPAPERQVIRPSKAQNLPSVVRTAPSVVPSGGRSGVLRTGPVGVPSAGGGLGRGYVSPGRSGAEPDSGADFSRSRGAPERQGSTSRGQSTARQGNAPASQSTQPATNTPPPRGPSRDNPAASGSKQTAPGRTQSPPPNSGSYSGSPPRSERPPSDNPASRSEKPAPAPPRSQGNHRN